jgi:hypothetical protein
LLNTANISANEGVFDENVDLDDVQEGAGAQNQTAGLHLQTLRRAHLLAEFSQASPRSPRPRHSLIAVNDSTWAQAKPKSYDPKIAGSTAVAETAVASWLFSRINVTFYGLKRFERSRQPASSCLDASFSYFDCNACATKRAANSRPSAFQ